MVNQALRHRGHSDSSSVLARFHRPEGGETCISCVSLGNSFDITGQLNPWHLLILLPISYLLLLLHVNLFLGTPSRLYCTLGHPL